jgi:mRNA interferase MazF
VVRRGTAFWLELETEGRRPVCVLTRDEAIPRLHNVVVALITSRKRGLKSEVALGPEDGMEACTSHG